MNRVMIVIVPSALTMPMMNLNLKSRESANLNKLKLNSSFEVESNFESLSLSPLFH